jgi:hypothetical protein
VGSRRAPRYPLLVLARPLLQHAVAAMLVVVALGGCGDSGAPPQSLPPLTQSPIPASPTPRPVTATRTADDLQRSAEQFIRAYYTELARANRTADPSVLERNYYGSGCRPCEFDVRTLNELGNKGQHIEGYDVTLLNVEAGELMGNTIAVTVVLRAKAGRIVDESGATIERLSPKGPLKTDLIVARTREGWRITEVVPLGEVK